LRWKSVFPSLAKGDFSLPARPLQGEKRRNPNFMSDTTIIKIDSAHSPRGHHGEKYLASGKTVSMRLWEAEQPGEPKEPVAREYETVGYVISGRAELHSEGQVVLLETGNSWVVPQGASHTYKILESFTAVEATHPPAQVHGRDES
jgi:quercetin dioxygenase-like cupin family protein